MDSFGRSVRIGSRRRRGLRGYPRVARGTCLAQGRAGRMGLGVETMALAGHKSKRNRGLVAAVACAAISAATVPAWAIPTPAVATGSLPCAYCRALPYSGMRDTIGSSHAENVAALF